MPAGLMFDNVSAKQIFKSTSCLANIMLSQLSFLRLGLGIGMLYTFCESLIERF